MARTLDRLIEFDDRSRLYGVRSVLPEVPVRKNRIWRCNRKLDQGQEGACVGFAWAHELNARPIEIPVSIQQARMIYFAAQRIDEWPGEDYEGTSVLAGAKVLLNSGYITEYRWAFGINDVLDTLATTGPLVMGSYWYAGMAEPGLSGWIYPTGEVLGGHATLLRGVNFKKEYVTIRNSWGRTWGRWGDARISFENLERLLDQDGEACIPLGRLRGNR